MKYILFIGDGMADNPVPELNGKTPIEAAEIPFIDYLAKNSEVGTVRTVPTVLPAGSDTAILTILGNNVEKSYSGRGPLEAAALDIFPKAGGAAYRCNLISVSDDGDEYEECRLISHSAGSIEGEDALNIVAALQNNDEFSNALKKAAVTIFPNPSFRQMATQENVNIRGIVLPPPHNYLGDKVGDHVPYGCNNASVLFELMKLSHKILNHHPINERRRAEGKLPANSIWFWAEGTAMQLDNFSQKYGKKGAVVSAVPLVQGIGKLIGLDVYLVEGATGEIDTNLEGKVKKTLEILPKYDFVVLHVEAPDECTHNGDLSGKIQSITWLDSRVLCPLVNALKESGTDFRILFLSDHKTLTSTRGHDGEPVPYMLYDSTQTESGADSFNERNALQGPFMDKGTDLMSKLFKR